MNDSNARIKVIGVGRSGISVANYMITSGLQEAMFIAVGTDKKLLTEARIEHTILLATAPGEGLNANDAFDVGRQAAEEALPAIKTVIGEADLVFIVAGMEDGTTNGAASVIAKAAKDAEVYLTVGVASAPFIWEGEQRADGGLQAFIDAADCAIVIPGDKWPRPFDAKNADILRGTDEALFYAVKDICDPITRQDLIGLDLADVHAVLTEGNKALMGIGVASGEHCARNAAIRAISCPHLSNSGIGNARGVFICITGNRDITIEEIAEASSIIQEAVHEDAKTCFGVVFDDAAGKDIRVTVIASGYLEEPAGTATPIAANREAFPDAGSSTESKG
ncbi:cell division protein FtsZ [Desulfovibrio sp. OttesenSCG-928-O18]|nr:cell division protein FtsZ [Desulfovibrio sp. OttesenSCG-928-O18]